VVFSASGDGGRNRLKASGAIRTRRWRRPAIAKTIATYEYTSYMEQVLLIVCATGILLYIFSDEYAKRRLSDEAVIKAQMEFERQLETNIDLPDGIRWRDAFIYRHLMRKWFASLLASSRCTATASDKIKSDWLDYMVVREEFGSD
jgi:hypothetical protein